jgi:hypothetical protein
MKKTPGLTVYKPVPLSAAIQFYNPRFAFRSTPTQPDLRSTIFWEPNIVTNKQGEAFTSFYAPDKAGTYNVVIQGSDLSGSVGYEAFKMIIK